jgi:hypothetical protein
MSTAAVTTPVTMTTNSIGSTVAYPYTASTVTFVDESTTTTVFDIDKTKLFTSRSWCPHLIINPVT